MSAQVLDCKAVAQSIQDQCKADADALRAKGIVPKLGIFRVGEKGPDLSYEKGATPIQIHISANYIMACTFQVTDWRQLPFPTVCLHLFSKYPEKDGGKAPE